MHGAPQEAAGPVAEEIADVDEDGRGGVVLGARGAHGHGGPGGRGAGPAGLELEAGLPAEAEEEGDAAVVGVGAGADVLPCGGGGCGGGGGGGEGGERGVVEEPEDVARRAAGAEVAVAEEGRGLDGEADAKEVVEL